MTEKNSSNTENLSRKAIVEAIIGNIPDYNFDDEEIVPATDEEVMEIEREYEEALEKGEIQPISEEEAARFKAFIEKCRQWYIYKLWKLCGKESYYDFEEWDNLVEKPVVPQEFIDSL